MLEGFVEAIIFRNDENGFTVLEVNTGDDFVVAVGEVPLLGEGERVSLTGDWVAHPSYGRQLKITSYEVHTPSNEEDIERYLASGVIRGIGESTAAAIVALFGAETLNIMQYAPHRLEEVRGIGPAKCKTISESFREQKIARDLLIGLQNYGITVGQAYKLQKAYGDTALDKIRENPYCMAEDIQGIGFKTADQIALKMGIQPDSPFRLAAGIKGALSWAMSEGHTFLPKETLLSTAEKLLSLPPEEIEAALGDLIALQQLFLRRYGETEAVYLPHPLYAEIDVAGRLCALVHDEESPDHLIREAQDQEGLELTDEQRAAVSLALSHGVCVITGGPGTGKTTILRVILRIFQSMGLGVELCAPTGRAAKRMGEATGYEAATLHRLLEYAHGETFQRNQEHPLLCDVVIIDEMSMVDIFLMRALLRALPEGARLIMVGDADQLPSVGPGNVLKDIIASGAVPVCRLREVHRQSHQSGIVVNAHCINRGEAPSLDQFDDFRFLPRDNVADALKLTLTACKKGFLGFDPACDIQVLSPMRKGELGVINLNKQIQQALNPEALGKAQHSFGEKLLRVGDRVIQTRNNYKLGWRKAAVWGEEEGQGVFNGDIGSILTIDEQEKTIRVLFDDAREASYDFGQADELDLAYCLSIHKSQGSEFPAVVLPLLGGPPMLFARNLLYTAITRARKAVLIIGREQSVVRMVNNNHIARRYSGLSSLLEQLLHGGSP
ncbi:MAG: ATP-dependent RecD-like DNA helicase [Christensenellales bacterium]|jgi:exodeoxyribonuclease V alpha subunit